jgi:hypothetical protein
MPLLSWAPSNPNVPGSPAPRLRAEPERALRIELRLVLPQGRVLVGKPRGNGLVFGDGLVGEIVGDVQQPRNVFEALAEQRCERIDLHVHGV